MSRTFEFTAPQLDTPLNNLSAAISIIQTQIMAAESDIAPKVMFGNYHFPTDHLQTAVALLVAIIEVTEDLDWPKGGAA